MGCAAAAACAPPPLWFSVADDHTIQILGPGATTSIAIPDVSQLAWGRNGLTLYAVAGTEQSTLYELQRDPATIVSQLALGESSASNIVIDAHARTLYVGVATHLHAFALTPLARQYSVAACDDRVVSLTLFESATKVFAVCASGNLVEIDTDLVQRQRVTPLPDCAPASLALSANETLLLVPCDQSGRLYLIDRVGLAVFDSIETGRALSGLSLETSRRNGIVLRSDGQADYLDLGARRVTAIDVGAPIIGATQTANGRMALMLDGIPPALVVVEAQRTTPILTISEMGRPVAFAVWPTDSPIYHFPLSIASPPFDAPKP